jgi:ATP-dependent exoDNAse (exonuclease V) beta subunit
MKKEITMDILNHPLNSKIKFNAKAHTYTHESGKKFGGVTSFIKRFKVPFNAQKQAKSSNKNPNSEWYDMGVKNILSAWKQKGQQSIIMGNAIHDAIEKSVNEQKKDDDMPYVQDMFWEMMKLHGITPVWCELVIHNEELELASAIDVLGWRGGKYVIIDTKSYEDGLTTKSYNSFLPPIQHLEESKYNYTALQTSFYKHWLETKYGVEVEDTPYCYWNNGGDHELYPMFDLEDEVKLLQEFK